MMCCPVRTIEISVTHPHSYFSLALELKERIDAFLAERRNKNTALDKSREEIVNIDDVDMDTA